MAKRWADRHEHVRWFDADTAPGASGTRNPRREPPGGTRLAFCDADDLVQPDWLAALAQALGDAEVVAGIFDFWSLNGRPNLPPVAAAMQQFGFLPAGLSANLAVRRDAFEEVGGFDEGAGRR